MFFFWRAAKSTNVVLAMEIASKHQYWSFGCSELQITQYHYFQKTCFIHAHFMFVSGVKGGVRWTIFLFWFYGVSANRFPLFCFRYLWIRSVNTRHDPTQEAHSWSSSNLDIKNKLGCSGFLAFRASQGFPNICGRRLARPADVPISGLAIPALPSMRFLQQGAHQDADCCARWIDTRLPRPCLYIVGEMFVEANRILHRQCGQLPERLRKYGGDADIQN